MPASNDDAVPSPCCGVCALDASGHLCVGCLRTVEEIAAWLEADDIRKRAILTRVAQRRHGQLLEQRDRRLKRCAGCATDFACGASDGGRCWCDLLPHVEPIAAATVDCFCPACLSAAIARHHEKSG